MRDPLTVKQKAAKGMMPNHRKRSITKDLQNEADHINTTVAKRKFSALFITQPGKAGPARTKPQAKKPIPPPPSRGSRDNVLNRKLPRPEYVRKNGKKIWVRKGKLEVVATVL